MNKGLVFYLFSFSLMLSACVKRDSIVANQGKDDKISVLQLPSNNFIAWVREPTNGLRKEHRVNEFTFSMFQKPSQYLALIDSRGEILSDSILKQREMEYSEMEYYDLIISVDSLQGEILKYNLSSKNDYEARIKYCAFEMQKDISMVNDGDTLPCSIFHFERAYDVTPRCTFLLAFDAKGIKKDKPRTIVYEDNLFKNGIIKFHYTVNDISVLPKLATDER